MTTTSITWAEHARGALDRAGHRRGGARDAVIDLLASESCARSALEIEDTLRGSPRRVSRASIYRILELLAEHGLISRLELGQGLARYEIVDPRGEHHHHLVCENCGKLVPFDDPELERAIVGAATRINDFTVADHEVVLHGACGDCLR